MKKILYIFSIIILLSFINTNRTLAFEKEEQDLLKHFQGVQTNRTERAKLLRKVQQGELKISDDAKNRLVDMFVKESNFQDIENLIKHGLPEPKAIEKFYSERGGKQYLQYYGDMASLISTFKDTRTIPPLLKGLHYYGGKILPIHIIGMGEAAVDPLLSASNSKDRTVKNTALFVLSLWVNAPIEAEDYSITQNLSIKNKNILEKIKDTFLEALKDQDVDVRSRAIFGLSAFPEDKVINELEEVVKSDPYYSEYSNKYPIREDAKKTIETLKTKKKN